VRVAWDTIFFAFLDCVANHNPHGVLAVSVGVATAGVLPESRRGDGAGDCPTWTIVVGPSATVGVGAFGANLVGPLAITPPKRNLPTICYYSGRMSLSC
jgi:hypothetical protein